MLECHDCGQIKEETEFYIIQKYIRENNKRIHSTKCKKCTYLSKEKWRHDNKEKSRASDNRYNSNNKRKRWAISTASQHKRRGYTIHFKTKELEDLTYKNDKCPYCNINLIWGSGNKSCKNTPTLERVDNEKFISLNNILIICHTCNIMKGSRTLKEFIEYINLVNPIIKNILNYKGRVVDCPKTIIDYQI